MSLNKVILIGNVGKDPDIHYFDSNAGVAKFSLATSEKGYTLATGKVIPDRTDWHNIVARRELVPFVEKYVRKGSSLLVEGKITYRDYQDKTGVKRYVTEIIADRISFYGSSSRPAQPNGGEQDSSSQTLPPVAEQPASSVPNNADGSAVAENPDGLPF